MKSLLSLTVIAIAAIFLSSSYFSFIDATYINGIGYNLLRPAMTIPQQAHQVQYPQEDTRPVAARVIREAALICDSIAPVMRAVQCEVHLFDECGNPIGSDFNVTQGWDVAVEELSNPGTFNRLVAPIVWLERGVGRFYFTPTHHGLHRVTLIRKPATHNRGFIGSDLRVSNGIGAAGFTVWVRDSLVKGMSGPIGSTNQAVRRMLWSQASHNAQPANYPPSMPATITFQDKEHRFDDRRFGELQEEVRRSMVQPEAFQPMPDRPARDDNNNFRLADYTRP